MRGGCTCWANRWDGDDGMCEWCEAQQENEPLEAKLEHEDELIDLDDVEAIDAAVAEFL